MAELQKHVIATTSAHDLREKHTHTEKKEKESAREGAKCSTFSLALAVLYIIEKKSKTDVAHVYWSKESNFSDDNKKKK